MEILNRSKRRREQKRLNKLANSPHIQKKSKFLLTTAIIASLSASSLHIALADTVIPTRGANAAYTITNGTADNYNFTTSDGSTTSYYKTNLSVFNLLNNINGSTVWIEGTQDNNNFSVVLPNSETRYFLYAYTKPDGWGDGERQAYDYNDNAAGNSAFYNNRTFNELNSLVSGGAIYIDGQYQATTGSNLVGTMTADFINNSITNTDTSERGVGGALYIWGPYAGIETLNSNFINNHITYNSTKSGGGALAIGKGWNQGESTVGLINGNFINNYIEAPSDNFGGAIYYEGSSYGDGEITSIGQDPLHTTKFVGNHILGTGQGGAIYAVNKIGSIYADFIGNYIAGLSDTSKGGAISLTKTSDEKTVGSITGDFIGNYITTAANNGTAWGGAIYNNNSVGSITGDFIGNYVVFSGTSNNDIYNAGGAIYNTGTITTLTSNFIGNYANSKNVYGGAIYNTGTITTLNGKFIENDAYANAQYGYNAVGGAIANKNNGVIQNISGDFISNKAHTSYTSNSSMSARGGAIYNEGAKIGTINANFIENEAQRQAGAIYNNGNSSNNNGIGTISGNFIKNKVTGEIARELYGGAIFNEGTIGDITANFTSNSTQAQSNNNQYYSAFGGAIANNGSDSSLGDITGVFDGNSAVHNFAKVETGNYYGAYGGAIYNNGGKIGTYEMDEYDNLVYTGGIKSSTFQNNKAESNQAAQGGAIWTNRQLNLIDTSFVNNSAISTAGKSYGGAIYAKDYNSSFENLGVISIKAKTANVTFSGNKAENGAAIYSESNGGTFISAEGGNILFENNNKTGAANGTGTGIYTASTLFLNTENEHTITINDNIDTSGGYGWGYLDVTPAGGNIYLNGSITTGSSAGIRMGYSESGALVLGQTPANQTFNSLTAQNDSTLSLQNNHAGDNLVVNTFTGSDWGSLKFNIDYDATANSMDKITVNAGSGTITLNAVNVINDNANFVDGTTAEYLDGAARGNITVISDAINSATDTGWLYVFTPTSTNGELSIARKIAYEGDLINAINDDLVGTYHPTSFSLSDNFTANRNFGALSTVNREQFTIFGNNHTISGDNNTYTGIEVANGQTLGLDNVTFSNVKTYDIQNKGTLNLTGNNTINTIADADTATGTTNINSGKTIFTGNTKQNTVEVKTGAQLENRGTITGDVTANINGATDYSIINKGTMTIDGATFKNTAIVVDTPVESDAHGGALYSSGSGTLTVTDSLFEGNSSKQTGTSYRYMGKGIIGGALSSESTNVVIEDTVFKNNFTETADGFISSFGGAAYLRGTNLSLTGNYVYDSQDPEQIIDSSTEFVGNRAGSKDSYEFGYGGALVTNFSGADNVIDEVVFKQNLSNFQGGALRNQSNLNDVSAYFDSNSVQSSIGRDNFTESGGAIHNNGTITNLTSTFVDNFALNDYVHDQYQLPSGYTPKAMGGAVYNVGTITNLNSDFIGNYADATYFSIGGALANGGTIGTISSTFKDNYVINHKQGRMYSGGIDAYANGGAIFNDGTINLIKNSVFDHNSALTTNEYNKAYGSAIYNAGTITTIQDSIFKNNTLGGVLYNFKTIGTISGSEFLNNADTAIVNTRYRSLINEISDSTFTGNNNGAILNSYTEYRDYDPVVIKSIDGTFTGNNRTKASYNNLGGGAIQNSVTSGYLSYKNSTVATIGNWDEEQQKFVGTAITGDFENNYVTSADNDAGGGAIANFTSYDAGKAEIGDIAGKTAKGFKGNHVIVTGSGHTAMGGAIFNKMDPSTSDDDLGAKIGNITANFTENYVQADDVALGGAIYSVDDTGIIKGNFTGNYASAKDARGGAIAGVLYLNIEDSSFYNNYTSGTTTSLGGAVYNEGTTIIKAAADDIVFRGNKANYGAGVYMGNGWGTLALYAKGGDISFENNNRTGAEGGNGTGIHSDGYLVLVAEEGQKITINDKVQVNKNMHINSGLTNLVSPIGTIEFTDRIYAAGNNSELHLDGGTLKLNAEAAKVLNTDLNTTSDKDAFEKFISSGGTLDIQNNNIDKIKPLSSSGSDISGAINLLIDVDTTADTGDKFVSDILAENVGVGSVIIKAINIMNDDAEDARIQVGLGSVSQIMELANDYVLSGGNYDITGEYDAEGHAYYLNLAAVNYDSINLAVTADDRLNKSYSLKNQGESGGETVTAALGNLIGHSLTVNGKNLFLDGDGKQGFVIGTYEEDETTKPQTLTLKNMTVKNFTTAVDNAGTLNVESVRFTGNTTADIKNTATLNLSGTNTINKITDNGTETPTGVTNITGGLTTIDYNGSVTQSAINMQGGRLAVNQGATVTSDVTGNAEYSYTGESGTGAIYNKGGSISNIKGTFSGNISSITYDIAAGGAINNSLDEGGTSLLSEITDVTANFTNNKAVAGGAINNYVFENEGHTVRIGNITGNFTNNSAQLYGGAINNYQGEMGTIANSSFTGNIAEGIRGVSASYGGAIRSYGGSIASVSDTAFINNVAEFGGAIYNDTSTISSISGATFDNNFAVSSIDARGGAIYNKGTIASIANTTFIDNAATNGLGGAIYNEGGTIGVWNANNQSFTGTAIAANFISNVNPLNPHANAYSGGAIYNKNGKIGNIESILDADTNSKIGFKGNKAYKGGAIYNYADGENTAAQAIIGNITADFTDNGVYGTAFTSQGGAIFNSADNEGRPSVAQIGNITGNFTNNNADIGGAIYNFAQGSDGNIATIGNITGNFTNNSALQGGAIYNYKGQLGTISNSLFSGNTATGNEAVASQGGAIALLYAGNTQLITDSSFTGNKAANGAAIYAKDTNVVISAATQDVEFTNNNTTGTAAGTGTGIYIDGGTLTLNADKVADTVHTITINDAIYSTNGISVNENGTHAGKVILGGDLSQAGSIGINAGTLEFTNSVSLNNNTAGMGGALHNLHAEVIFDDAASFIGNSATTENGGSGKGGAVSNLSGTMSFNNGVTFKNNTSASSGSAIYNALNYQTAGVINISGNALFEGNTSTSNEYAVHNLMNDTVDNTIAFSDGNVTFKDNIGGALWNQDKMTFTDIGVLSFEGNKITKEKSSAAISNVGNLTIAANTVNFKNNESTRSAVGNTSSSSVLNIVADTVNFDTNVGGAIYKENDILTITAANDAKTGLISFTNNYGSAASALNNNGNTSKSTLTADKVVFNSNTSSASYGGAIFNSGTSIDIISKDILFKNNQANGTTDVEVDKVKFGGGAIQNRGNSGTTITIGRDSSEVTGPDDVADYAVVFENNRSAMHGGAIHARAEKDTNSGSVVINANTTFTNNEAMLNGGAISNSPVNGNSTVFITGNSIFKDNISRGGAGGAIYSTGNYGSVGLNGTSTFTGNFAATNGGAIYNNASDFGLYDVSTFTSNTALGLGGAIYNDELGELYIYGSTFSGNKASYVDADNYVANDIHNLGTIYFGGENTLEAGITGTGAVDIAYDSSLITPTIVQDSVEITGTLKAGEATIGTLSFREYDDGDNVHYGLFDAKDGVVTNAPYTAGTITGEGGLLNIDVDLRGDDDPWADTIYVSNGGNANLTLTINDISIFNEGASPNFNVPILLGETDGLTLALSTALQNDARYNIDAAHATYEQKVVSDAVTSQIDWVTYDKIGTRQWDEAVLKSLTVEGNNLKYQQWIDTKNYSADEKDAIAFMNQTTQFGSEEKKMTETTPFLDYEPTTITLSGNLGETYGTFTLRGITKGDDISTVNFTDANNNSYTGFEVGEGATLNLDTVKLTNASSTTGGSVINAAAGGIVNITNSEFVNNTSTSSGGAIYNEGTMTIADSTFTNNSATGQSGAIHQNNTSSNLTLNNVTFDSNHSDWGGSVVARGIVDITGGSFVGNYSNDGGGAIYLATLANKGHKLSIDGTTFTNNYTLGTGNEDGGGAIGSFSDLTVANATFTGNEAKGESDGGAGGAIIMGSVSTNSISNTQFNQNKATTHGGAIATRSYALGDNHGATLDITGSTFTGNTATTDGGAISNYLYNDANNDGYVKVTNSTFTTNSAANGGAIYNHIGSGNDVKVGGEYQVGKMYIADATFTGNSATTKGGAIYNEGTMTINGSTFENNTASNVANDIYNIGSLSFAGENTLPGGITGTGTTNVAGNVTVGAITQNIINITDGKLASLGSVTAQTISNAVAGGLELQGGTLTANVSGDGSTLINTNGTVIIADGSTISQAVAVQAGTLQTGVGGFTSDITSNTGTVNLTGTGYLTHSIAGNTNISGNITNSATLANATVASGGALTTSAADITGNIVNAGTLNLSGTLDKTVSGGGVTVANSDLTLREGAGVTGTLNANDKALILSGDNTATQYTVGTLAGAGTLSIDIFNNAASGVIYDSINATTYDDSMALQINNITGLADIVTGLVLPTTTGDSSSFSLNVLNGYEGTGLTVASAISSAYSGSKNVDRSHTEELRATVDWTDKFTAETWQDIYNQTFTVTNGTISYLVTKTAETAHVFADGDTLQMLNTTTDFGTEERTFYTNDETANYDVTFNLGQTSEGTMTVKGVTDGTNISTIDMNSHTGFVVGENTTLNIDTVKIVGTKAEDGSLINNTAGTVNLYNIEVASNASDVIANNSVLNVTDSTINSGITGSGTTNVNGDSLISRITQKVVEIFTGAKLETQTVAATNGVNNAGELTITGTTNTSDISGAGSTKFTNNANNTGNISQSTVEIASGKTLTTTGDVTVTDSLTMANDSTITLNSLDAALNLNGGSSEAPMSINGTVTGTGNAVINGNVQNNGTIAAAVQIETGNLSTAANTVTGGVTNNAQDGLTLTGGNLASAISGTGSTNVTGNVTNTSDNVIANAVKIESGSLSTDASKVTGGVENNTAGGLILTGGNIASEISGMGTTNITGNVTNTGNQTIATDMNVSGSLTTNADNIGGNITSSGTVDLTGGQLNKEISGGAVTISGATSTNADNLHANTTVSDGQTLSVTGGTIANAIAGGTVAITGDTANNAAVSSATTVAEGVELAVGSNGSFTSTLTMNDGSTLNTQNGSTTTTTVINNLVIADGANINAMMKWGDTLNGSLAGTTGGVTVTSFDVNGTTGTPGAAPDSYAFTNLGTNLSLADDFRLTNVSETTYNTLTYNSTTGSMFGVKSKLVDAVQNTDAGERAAYSMVNNETGGGGILEGVLTIQGNGRTVQTDGTSLTGSDSIVVGNGTTPGADLVMEDVNLGNVQTGAQKASVVVKGGNALEYKAKSGDVSINGSDNGTGIYLEKDANGTSSVTLTAEGGKIGINDDIRSDDVGNVVNFNGSNEIDFSGIFDPVTANVNTTVNRLSGYDEAITYNINAGGRLNYTNDATLYDPSHHTTPALMNTINFNGGALNTMNGVVTDFYLNNMSLNGVSTFYADVDLANKTMDRFTVLNPVTGSGTLNVAGLNLISDATALKTSINFTTDPTLMSAVNYTGSQGLSAMSSMFKYNVGYDKTNGNFDFTRFMSGGTPMQPIYRDMNPSAVAAPVAAQMGGYLTQLNSYNQAFNNMDMYMLMPKEQRQALKLRNKYADVEGRNLVYDGTGTHYDNTALWFNPYSTFENVSLNNGPDVSNVAYGSFFGGDTKLFDLKHGWEGMYSLYAGYNGSHQTYDGIGIYQNGGTIGLTGMLYKGNFFGGLTANVGANGVVANTGYGREDFAMLMAGVAAKAGYNWELAKGKFIIQPSYMMSYSFVNAFNHKNPSGINISSDPLNAIHIEPGLKFILNLKNGWQPYAGISVVWNIMDKTAFKANDVSLPDLSVKPYVKYGIGVRKTWGEKFSGFLQAYMTNGGRNGIGLQAGFRWTLGKENPSSKKLKSSIPEQKTNITLNGGK